MLVRTKMFAFDKTGYKSYYCNIHEVQPLANYITFLSSTFSECNLKVRESTF